jgi:hypothetical protein
MATFCHKEENKKSHEEQTEENREQQDAHALRLFEKTGGSSILKRARA